MCKAQDAVRGGQRDDLAGEPPCSLGPDHAPAQTDDHPAVGTGPRVFDPIVGKELVAVEAGVGLEMPHVAAPSPVVEREPELGDARKAEIHDLSNEDASRPARKRQGEVGECELHGVGLVGLVGRRKGFRAGQRARKERPDGGRGGQPFGAADLREVQPIKPSQTHRRRRRGRGGHGSGNEDEREEMRQAAHERACGFASATSMISLCSSWATAFVAPGEQNVCPSVRLRRSPITSMGNVVVTSSILPKGMRRAR